MLEDGNMLAADPTYGRTDADAQWSLIVVIFAKAEKIIFPGSYSQGAY